jgi:hypothetical protein
MTWPKIKPGQLLWKLETNSLSYGMALLQTLAQRKHESENISTWIEASTCCLADMYATSQNIL